MTFETATGPVITSEALYRQHWQQAQENPSDYWGAYGRQFAWRKPFELVMRSDFAKAEFAWFEGGKLNITENALDRWATSSPDRPALIWEPGHPEEKAKTFTYAELLEQVVRTAAALRRIGVQKGDRICIYMPMIPELAVAVLACARIGAVHSVIFGGFSAQAVADRIQDAGARVVLTAGAGRRNGKEIPLKAIMDEALTRCPEVARVLVLGTPGLSYPANTRGRDLDWATTVAQADPAQGYAEEMDAEDMLFILYTSGSTGKPKGVVHTTAGYMVWAHYTFNNVFQYKPGQVFFCTADVGWITGHSYLLYGPLLSGATTVMFEGTPTWPQPDRFWRIVERHKVNILYTAPTAIRSLMACEQPRFEDYDLSSLQVLGSVGEPINEEAWQWYHTYIGQGRCPIVDTWWQTETGGCMISAFAGVTPSIPAWATLPLPGVVPALLDEKGKLVEGNPAKGNLVLCQAWPGMMRTTFGDHERFRQTYFTQYPGYYTTGDAALRDEQGNYRITGRTDDVINVSGHRISTAEVESAIDSAPGIVEAAVVGRPHPVKGQALYAYVVFGPEYSSIEEARKAIAEQVNKEIGPLARPDWIQGVSGLPKTRSGKIMRRILRKIAEGDLSNLGDTTTLTDPAVVDEIAKGRIP